MDIFAKTVLVSPMQLYIISINLGFIVYYMFLYKIVVNEINDNFYRLHKY